MSITFTPAFLSGLKAGLAAPLALYSPPVAYSAPAQAFSPANAFGAVGVLLTKSASATKAIND
jgi:hypothetical protein